MAAISSSAASMHKAWNRFIYSIWLFPILMAIPLVLFTALKIHGSSIGAYQSILYGNTENRNLILNQPQSIRSDEWLVNTQLTIAQKNNNFERVNKNIGNGQDLSLMVDVPYKEWSTLFKPHNLAFFVLPFDNAFAFRWWLMAYLLIISCYFFILALLPDKRLLASLLSIALFFAPFIQWWYLFGTLGIIYYSFFGGIVLIKLLNERRLLQSMLWGLLLAYVLVCFAVILYPPFQIPCALVMFAFVVGYFFEKLRNMSRQMIWQKVGIVIGSTIVAGAITLVFLSTRLQVVHAVQNTVYPGNRIQRSGGFDMVHLFSGHLGAQLQDISKFGHYLISGRSTNQSEASNFVLLLPFLLLPSVYLLCKYYKNKRRVDWPLVFVNGLFLLLFLWLFVPHLGIVGKLTILEQVPHVRLLIGLGLLGILQVVLFIRRYKDFTDFLIKRRWVFLYALLVFFVEVGLSLYVIEHSPGFARIRHAIAFSLPLPVALYLLMRKRFEWAAAILVVFTILMSFRVNPLYHGTEILSETPASKAIKRIGAQDDSAWAVEYSPMENFAFMNGERSLSGVYTYPQLDLWRNAGVEDQEQIYNRYAHTSFSFDRNPNQMTPTRLELRGGDNFAIKIEPCSDFFRKNDVRYILAAAEFSSEDKCASLVEQINYPLQPLFIYRLTFIN